jgi:hypothetical protein
MTTEERLTTRWWISRSFSEMDVIEAGVVVVIARHLLAPAG